MGVKGLWELLSPVGRRINIETLEGKTLAIDASIWITQFIKAMRDEEGKVVKNAHLIGTLRRILKLLHNRIRTVFVFDGSTPTLKIQTVKARRLLREKQEVNIKKSAERLLLAKIKQHILQQNSSSKQSKNGPSRIAPEFHPLQNEESSLSEGNSNGIVSSAVPTEEDVEDEWEDGYSHFRDKELSTDSPRVPSRIRNRSDEEESDWMIPEDTEEIDASTLASLPPTIRKNVIEEARKKESRKNRAHYLPVAEDPLLYSKTQLANFLRTSKFNKVVIKTQEESDRLEREKFGSGQIISSDGNRRYILRKGNEEEENNESPEEDMSWLNDSDSEEVEPKSSKQSGCKGKGNEGTPKPSSRLFKKRRVVEDESDSGSGVEVEGGGGFIHPDEELDVNESEEEGGFIREQAEDPLKQVTVSVGEPMKNNQSEQWICANCTLFNDIFDTTCVMCGTSHFSSPNPRRSEDINSSVTPQVTLISNPSPLKSCPVQKQNDHQELPPEPSPVVLSPSHSESNSDDEWEDNDYDDNTLSSTVSPDIAPALAPLSASHIDLTPTLGAPNLNQNTITRAVMSASSMGDWAGRAVRRALQGSSLAPTISIKTTVAEGESLLSRDRPSQPDDPPALPMSSPSLDPSSAHEFMSTSRSLTDMEGDDDDNGFDVDQLEFERKAMRDADVLSDGMVNDIKALLDAFEIPYISAPYEAEAQCAFLEMAGVVDGVVTEDSDIFLFGGKCVYRNIFEEKKYVEVYLAEDIRRDLGVDRSDLIAMAYLLGSDYTDGVKGIGIVNAMEILDVFGSQSKERIDQRNMPTNSSRGRGNRVARGEASDQQSQGGFFSSFNSEEIIAESASEAKVEKESGSGDREGSSLLKNSLQQLEDFKEWLLAPYDFSTLKSLKSKKRKSRTQEIEDDDEEEDGDEEKEREELQQKIQKIKENKLEEFSRRHAGMRKKWSVRESFPDPKIAEAYFSPQVNSLTEKFPFEIPKLFKIKKYVSSVLGWTEEEIANKITPVIQRSIAEREGPVQSRIDSYFLTYHDNKRFASIQSERLRGAVTRVRRRQQPQPQQGQQGQQQEDEEENHDS